MSVRSMFGRLTHEQTDAAARPPCFEVSARLKAFIFAVDLGQTVWLFGRRSNIRFHPLHEQCHHQSTFETMPTISLHRAVGRLAHHPELPVQGAEKGRRTFLRALNKPQCPGTKATTGLYRTPALRGM